MGRRLLEEDDEGDGLHGGKPRSIHGRVTRVTATRKRLARMTKPARKELILQKMTLRVRRLRGKRGDLRHREVRERRGLGRTRKGEGLRGQRQRQEELGGVARFGLLISFLQLTPLIPGLYNYGAGVCLGSCHYTYYHGLKFKRRSSLSECGIAVMRLTIRPKHQQKKSIGSDDI